eukprot:m.77817 g.77817  ORF g.77817 m.77817 type:complete len:325 (-) comp7931_c0_seq1:1190-2164(-)
MATIEDLPNEILLRIFEFVPFFHVVNTVSRVCVRWKDLSGQGIPLDLSFNREHMDVVDDMFLSHLSKFRLRQIDLSSATHTAAFDGFQVTASGLACLRNCPTLKSIVIHRRDIGRSALVELLKFQSLESLDIIGSTTGPPIGGHSGGYPLLRSLRRLAASTEAWDWSAFANLEELGAYCPVACRYYSWCCFYFAVTIILIIIIDTLNSSFRSRRRIPRNLIVCKCRASSRQRERSDGNRKMSHPAQPDANHGALFVHITWPPYKPDNACPQIIASLHQVPDTSAADTLDGHVELHLQPCQSAHPRAARPEPRCRQRSFLPAHAP